MLSNYRLAVFKRIFLMLIASIFLVACDKGAEDSNVTVADVPVPTLSDKNIKAFTRKMAKDYNVNLDSLVVAFNQAKKNDEAYTFVDFRNQKWTPDYIKQKDYYQKVLAKNAAYLSKSPAKSLFDAFENLIYIGVNLKNALLDNDEVKLQAQLEEINKEKTLVNRFTK